MTSVPPIPGGSALLRDALANRGTGFTAAERRSLGIEGFLPPRVESIGEQCERVLANLRALGAPLDKHLYLAALQDQNETLFYRVLVDNLEEMLPLVYTPTVGQACQEWSRRFMRPRGLYITPEHRGRIAAMLSRWRERDVGIVVVTDGERILGLGDLGANGMGIPVGKLALYTACAGVPPARTLPVTLDVGTNTAAVREDPFYLGRRVARLAGAAYDEFVDEFVAAVRAVFPRAILQFEDFGNANAFRLLSRHRDAVCCFNDDIQGTGAMGLAGLTAAARALGRPLTEARLMFVGAGQACLGIGALAAAAMRAAGLTAVEARERCMFVDSRGVVSASRVDLAPHKRPFALDCTGGGDLVAAIEAFRPTALIGACGQGARFSRPVLEALARGCDRPVVFALSNPTQKAECTAEEAYAATGGRALYASGSPFAPVRQDGRVHVPGQANNAWIFPGVGLGLLVSGATRVSDAMFEAAARSLAGLVTPAELDSGRLFPPAARLREAAATVAAAVAAVAFDDGLARAARPSDLGAAITAAMYRPEYT